MWGGGGVGGRGVLVGEFPSYKVPLDMHAQIPFTIYIAIWKQNSFSSRA